jgi:hypothetical protein
MTVMELTIGILLKSLWWIIPCIAWIVAMAISERRENE